MMLASDQMRAERAREIRSKEVNRLIIIGNGFDLAHGLKTSFKDFIEDYSLQILHRIRELGFFEDKLLYISHGARFHHHFPDFDSYTPPNRAYQMLSQALKDGSLKTERQSKFLKIILAEIEEKKWVDIELIFFKILKNSSDGRGRETVKLINSEMDFLKKLLKDYLKRVVENQSLVRIVKLHTQFKGMIRVQETEPNTIGEDKKVKFTCLLNFNYTDTPSLYFNEFEDGTYQHIKIHGNLDGDDINSQGLVFGFGDELDEEYLKFENMENDELFQHIKSFKYLQFQNYRNLLEFIESKPFQVHVYGHSLGLSDRTLLNTIFENENCISIKLFYHQWEGRDDYEQKTFAISRHFKRKASLRSKVVNKEFCEPMGQFNHS